MSVSPSSTKKIDITEINYQNMKKASTFSSEILEHKFEHYWAPFFYTKKNYSKDCMTLTAMSFQFVQVAVIKLLGKVAPK